MPWVKGVINASTATSATVITGNTFYDNSIPLVISGDVSLDDSNVFHNPANTAQTNTYNGIFFTGNSANYIHTVSWGETEVPFVIQGEIFVPTGYTLTLGNNVVLKFASLPSRLTLYGNVSNIQGTGVALTSINDDSFLGDTNGNGSSLGASGDWKGVRDGNTSGLPYLTYSSEHYNKCNSGSLLTC